MVGRVKEGEREGKEEEGSGQTPPPNILS